MRDALLELFENRCEICHKPKRSLIFIPRSGRFQCFDCVGHENAEPVIIRERGDLTEFDRGFLEGVRISWQGDERTEP